MDPRDWALVIFTVATQASVGAFLTLVVLRRMLSGPSRAAGGSLEFRPLLSVLLIFCLGLIAALFHLSDPLQALRAVANIASSWLSREIVCGGLFAAGLTLLVFMASSGGRPASWSRWIVGATVCAGVAFLYCQIAIYRLPSQPVWDTAATPAAFLATTVRLGVLGVAISAPGLQKVRWVGVLALLSELLIMPLLVISLDMNGSPAAVASVQRLMSDYGGVLSWRLGLLVVGVATLSIAVVSSRRFGDVRLTQRLTWGACAVVVLSEVCGRFLFYATRVRVGI